MGRGNSDGLGTAAGHQQPGARRAPGGMDKTAPLRKGTDEHAVRLVHRCSSYPRAPTAAASRSDPHDVSLRSRETGRRRSARRALAAVAKLAECSNRGGGAVIAPDAAGGPIIRGRAPAEAGSVILGVRERAWRFREGPVTQRTMQATGPEPGDAVMNDLRPELALAIPWKGDAPATHASKTPS